MPNAMSAPAKSASFNAAVLRVSGKAFHSTSRSVCAAVTLHAAVEVSAFGALTFRRPAGTRQPTRDSGDHHKEACRRVRPLIELFHAPCAGHGCNHQREHIDGREGEQRAPCEGVTDASIQRIRPVLIEAQNVGARLDAGQLPAQAGHACAREHSHQPCEIGPSHTASEEAKGKRAGHKEEDPDPDGPVRQAIVRFVPFSNSPRVRVLHWTVVWHIRRVSQSGPPASIA